MCRNQKGTGTEGKSDCGGGGKKNLLGRSPVHETPRFCSLESCSPNHGEARLEKNHPIKPKERSPPGKETEFTRRQMPLRTTEAKLTTVNWGGY